MTARGAKVKLIIIMIRYNQLLQAYLALKLYYKITCFSGMLVLAKSRLFNTKKLVEAKKWHNSKCPVFLRTQTTDIKIFQQIFIRRDYDFNVQKMPKVIIDAGANIGLSTVFFANKFPKAKIIAIEPEVTNFELLKKNTACYQNVVLLQAALWKENKAISLFDPGYGKWGFMIDENKTITNQKDNMLPQTVKGITIDQIITEYDIKEVDILKIDIEGSECEVFRDPRNWLGDINSIIIELHDCMRSGCSRNFYNSTNGFDKEWIRGENVYLSREGILSEA